QGEVEIERAGLELGAEAGVGEERLHLGREQESAVYLRVVQRLDTQPVTREQQSAALCIPEGESEHPLEQVHRGVAVLLVQMHQHLGIATGPEAVPVRLEAGAQFAGIV